jgi:hypothetical protein
MFSFVSHRFSCEFLEIPYVISQRERSDGCLWTHDVDVDRRELQMLKVDVEISHIFVDFTKPTLKQNSRGGGWCCVSINSGFWHMFDWSEFSAGATRRDYKITFWIWCVWSVPIQNRCDQLLHRKSSICHVNDIEIVLLLAEMLPIDSVRLKTVNSDCFTFQNVMTQVVWTTSATVLAWTTRTRSSVTDSLKKEIELW